MIATTERELGGPTLPQYGDFIGRCDARITKGGMVLGRSSDASLFVYEGGVHYCETVKYTVSKPYLEFHSGPRAVSVPWRLLRLSKVREGEKKGVPFVRVEISLPDKRTLAVDSRFKGDVLEIIEKVVTLFPRT